MAARVVALLHHAAAVAPHHASWNAHHRGVGGYVLNHHGVAADAHVVAHLDVAEHLGARAHDHVVAERGVALAVLVARAAQGNSLVEGAVVAHDGGLANNDAHGMVDKEPAAELRAGVNLDPGKEPRDLAEHARGSAQAVRPEPVLGGVHPLSVEAGVGDKDGKGALRGGVVGLNVGDVLADGGDEAHGGSYSGAFARRRAPAGAMYGRPPADKCL